MVLLDSIFILIEDLKLAEVPIYKWLLQIQITLTFPMSQTLHIISASQHQCFTPQELWTGTGTCSVTPDIAVLLPSRVKRSCFHFRTRSQAREPQEKVNATTVELVNDLLAHFKAFKDKKERDKVEKVQSNCPQVLWYWKRSKCPRTCPFLKNISNYAYKIMLLNNVVSVAATGLAALRKVQERGKHIYIKSVNSSQQQVHWLWENM